MSGKRVRGVCLALGLVCLAAAAGAFAAEPVSGDGARAEAVPRDGVPQVRARLLVHPDDLPAADSLRVGLLLDLAPGWHTYWREPGESGLAPELDWQIEGATVGPVAWPAPERFLEQGEIETFGYAGQVLLASRARVLSPGAPPSRARLEARILVCETECIPARFVLERSLLAPADAAAAAEERLLFEGHAQRLLPGEARHLDGAAPRGGGLLAALGLALLGGLLLNAMPCVLPVLAIKAFALTELASRSRSEARLQGLAYAAGVLGSMGVLAALVVALRAAGRSVGWGFQFQEPLFVVAIASLLVVFALNLFGVFEIGAPRIAGAAGAAGSGWRRSFCEGLLAVALATPCTAPFLGTALGLAFAAPGPWVAAIFAAVGVGLAAPFVVLSWEPGWSRFLPRSGPWMQQVRAALGFALLGSVVWLAWVFGRSAGSDALVALLAFLLAVALLAWIYGALQAAGRRWLPRAALLAGAGLVLAAPAVVGLEPAPAPPGPAGWQPFAPAQVESELRRGRPVFVSFTADWCITCKLNERLVLSHPRVRAALAARDFALLRADWTRRDEAIRAELARFGRAGVPLYLIYRPEAPARPAVLPELLSIEGVLEALDPRPAAA